MSVLRVQAEMQRDTALPGDVCINVWHCATSTSVDPGRTTEAGLFIDALHDWYLAVDQFFSGGLDGVITFRAYDLAEPPVRVPILEVVDAITPSANVWPGEVALCFSFQAAAESGVNQQSKRNRIYMPVSSAGSESVVGGVRPSAATRSTIAAAGTALLDASELAATWNWITFSPKLAGYDPNTGIYADPPAGQFPVDNGWIDNAYDTMRSRGLEPTARTTWIATP